MRLTVSKIITPRTSKRTSKRTFADYSYFGPNWTRQGRRNDLTKHPVVSDVVSLLEIRSGTRARENQDQWKIGQSIKKVLQVMGSRFDPFLAI